MSFTSTQTLEGRVLTLAYDLGVIRPRDLIARGVATAPLTALVRRGALVRHGRGLYSLPNADVTENHSLVEAAVRVPAGVVCLMSALRFHELGTQSPHQVWMAIHPKARLPKVDYPSLHFVRFSGPALTLGVEIHLIEGISVPIFGAAKTVVDCFRYRNKLGLDVALEALRAYLRRGGSPDDLWELAMACRIGAVMKPYIEASL